MQQSEVEQFIVSAKQKKTWLASDFLSFCREGVWLAKQYPEFRSEIAYWIVEKGRHFGDFNSEDKDSIRQEIKDLAADLELPDAHVDVSDGLDVGQKWDQLEKLINAAIEQRVS